MAMKIIRQKGHASPQSIYEAKVINQAHRILNDPAHILYHEYEPLPSGKDFRASRHKNNRFKLSFLPTSIALSDKDSHT